VEGFLKVENFFKELEFLFTVTSIDTKLLTFDTLGWATLYRSDVDAELVNVQLSLN